MVVLFDCLSGVMAWLHCLCLVRLLVLLRMLGVGRNIGLVMR